MSADRYLLRQAERADVTLIRSFCAETGDGPLWPEKAWSEIAGDADGAASRETLLLFNAQDTLAGWITGTLLLTTAELEYIGIAPGERRRGLGKVLLAAWLRATAQQGATEWFLEVRPSNRVALSLYQGCGFVETGRRRGYYQRPDEDALVLHLTSLTRVPGEQPPVQPG